MTFRQLELGVPPPPPTPIYPPPTVADGPTWYLDRLPAEWLFDAMVLEERTLVVLKCHRGDTPQRSVLIYVPFAGSVVADVYIDSLEHIRTCKGDRLLA